MNTQEISKELKAVSSEPVTSFFPYATDSLLINSEYIMNTDIQEFSKLQTIRYLNLVDTIKGFSNLQPNWDSYQADKISKNAIDTAIETLDYMRNNGVLQRKMTTNVFPMRDGGIQFEFDGDAICAELEINQYGKRIFILYDEEGNLIESTLLLELSELSTRL